MGLDCSSDNGRTQQHFKDECDINFIVDRWVKTGVLTHVSHAEAVVGDFDGPEDYQEAVERVFKAQESFQALPSEIRSRFANDPALLMRFVSDPENQAEAVKLGLANAPPEPTPEPEPTPAPTPPETAPPAPAPIIGGE